MEITLTLLLAHFIADFVLQSDWMALNKSKDFRALIAHTSVYSLCFLPWGIEFAAITFAVHTLQDMLTSRLNSWLWINNKRHWFFVGIGADQLLHYAQLALTFKLFS